MIARAVQSYLSVRRAAGFELKNAAIHLRSFAAYSDAHGQRHVARAAGSARSHFHDVQCSTARIKGTRGTRYFAPDALPQPVA